MHTHYIYILYVCVWLCAFICIQYQPALALCLANVSMFGGEGEFLGKGRERGWVFHVIWVWQSHLIASPLSSNAVPLLNLICHGNNSMCTWNSYIVDYRVVGYDLACMRRVWHVLHEEGMTWLAWGGYDCHGLYENTQTHTHCKCRVFALDSVDGVSHIAR